MKLYHVVSLLLLLQLWQKTVLSISNTSCPSHCQCFSTTTVICSDLLMKALPANIPANATALIVLASGLKTITAVKDLKNLTKLVFISNPVQNISHNAFEHLTSLQELEISGTFVLALEAGLFNKLDKLTKLLLNNNHRIRVLAPNLFESLEKLEVLQLRGGMLQSLHKAMFLKLTNLQELNLSSNQLCTVDTSKLSKLKKLDLGLNQITTLSQDTFNGNLQLQILSLQGNQISNLVPGIFSHLDNLQKLNLRDNKLKELSSGLFPSSLKNLMLKGNSLLQLYSSTFTNLHNLTYLDLSQNLLSSLPAELFQDLSSLEHLDLSWNRLVELSSTVFRGLFQISVINLQKNNLTSLKPDLFIDQGNMSRLILAGNQLENLPSSILEMLDLECMLQLRGNPWRCDCNLAYFHEWLYYSSSTVQDLSEVYCTEPQALRGISLTTVNKEQLVCINRTISKTEATVTQATSSVSDKQCSLQEGDGEIVIRCELMTCPDLKLDVCFHQEDGSVLNYTVTKPWPGSSHCSNGTVILTV